MTALSFFFPKLGHMFLNYQNFLFYERLNEGHLLKNRKKLHFLRNTKYYHLNKSFFGESTGQKVPNLVREGDTTGVI